MHTKKQYRRSLIAGSFITAFLVCSSSFTGWSLQNDTYAPADRTYQQQVPSVPEKPEDISPLLIGESIPEINLHDATGKSFNLNQAVAASPTILIFYRGGWCPYCSRQLAGIQEIEQDLKKLGYNIIAVSTDSPENLSKTLGEEKLSYTLLSDSELTAAKKFGIAYKGPKAYDKILPEASGGKNVDKLLPVPSVFILDTAGKIQFEYINPNIKDRMSEALLKAVATTLMDELQTKK